MKFSIRFTVGEEAVGPVLAALNSHPGVVFNHLAIEPLSPPPAKAEKLPEFLKRKSLPPVQSHKERRKALAGKAVNAQDHVLNLLLDGKPHRYGEVQTMLNGVGFSAVGSTLRHLEKKGLAEKCDGGWRVVPFAPKVEAPALVKEG